MYPDSTIDVKEMIKMQKYKKHIVVVIVHIILTFILYKTLQRSVSGPVFSQCIQAT